MYIILKFQIQIFPLPSGFIVGDGRFQHMAGAVQLVPVAVLPAVLGLDHGKEDIEVAVLMLIGGDVLHDLVYLGLQGGIGVVGQNIGRALHPLGDVAVPEIVGLDGVLLGEAVLEGADASRLGEAVVHGVYGDLAVQLFLIEEEAALEVDLAMGDDFHNGTSFIVGASIVQ